MFDKFTFLKQGSLAQVCFLSLFWRADTSVGEWGAANHSNRFCFLLRHKHARGTLHHLFRGQFVLCVAVIARWLLAVFGLSGASGRLASLFSDTRHYALLLSSLPPPRVPCHLGVVSFNGWWSSMLPDSSRMSPQAVLLSGPAIE